MKRKEKTVTHERTHVRESSEANKRVDDVHKKIIWGMGWRLGGRHGFPRSHSIEKNTALSRLLLRKTSRGMQKKVSQHRMRVFPEPEQEQEQ
jgi:hypothetical protein